MRFKVVSVLSLFVSLSSFAVTPAQEEAMHREGVVIVGRPEGLLEGTSESNRLGKTFSITGQLFGYGPNPALSQGVAAGYFINRNSMVLFEVTGNNQNTRFMGSSFETKTSSVGVHFKQFFGNSFYARAGVDYRKVSHKYDIQSIFSDSDFIYRSEFEGSSMAATILIGNQWQWSNFTLGCDWIGYVAPFSSTVTKEVVAGRSIEFHEDDKKRLLRDSIPQLLRFYLGASF